MGEDRAQVTPTPPSSPADILIQCLVIGVNVVRHLNLRYTAGE